MVGNILFDLMVSNSNDIRPLVIFCGACVSFSLSVHVQRTTVLAPHSFRIYTYYSMGGAGSILSLVKYIINVFST